MKPKTKASQYGLLSKLLYKGQIERIYVTLEKAWGMVYVYLIHLCWGADYLTQHFSVDLADLIGQHQEVHLTQVQMESKYPELKFSSKHTLF